MKRTFFLDAPANFSFRHTVYAHGWCSLPPFELDEDFWRLTYVFTGDKCKAATATISDAGGKACPDKTIERHYKKFGSWRGLAIWCDMTERWFNGKL